MEIDTTNFQLVMDRLPSAMSYEQYRNLVAKLVIENKTTGELQTESLIEYTKLNDRRMNRWDKTLKIKDTVISKIKSVDKKYTWLVLTESWCGDASPAIPVMNKFAQLNPNISLLILLRDEHPEVMNQFLTNGAMSIPKLLVIDPFKNSVQSTWGPRSRKATQLVDAYKQNHGELTPEFKQDLQVFYNKDKGESLVEDLLGLLPLK